MRESANLAFGYRDGKDSGEVAQSRVRRLSVGISKRRIHCLKPVKGRHQLTLLLIPPKRLEKEEVHQDLVDKGNPRV
jgi:hypothetical protein